mmetsp:Transcript_20905/g.45515  ORF Transcript_20905/g.45515 Transcript_20905/m.45515 type:complete len:278 (-) Transcript_20905:757-1590(-)
MVRQDRIKGTGGHGCLLDGINFGIRVRLELVHRNHHINPKFFGILNVFRQIGASLFQQFDILFRVFFLERLTGRHGWAATMHFQSPDRRDNYGRLGFQSAVPALDIEEFFHSNVGPETSLRDAKSVGTHQLEGNLISHDRRISRGNVSKWSCVDQYGRSFDGLHKRWHDGILHQYRQSSTTAQVIGRDGLSLSGKSNDHSTEFFPQVFERLCQSQSGHHFRSNGNIETGLPIVLNTFSFLVFGLDGLSWTLAHRDIPQVTIAGIHNSLPGDGIGVQI